ncbi:hypothetical protein COY06_01545, partial [Candidatus Peregrinibacteria bacterium CG_4_10_14_0_2_um_filter_41_8]
FEDPEKLKRLTDAGFEASHLSQIVRNAGWEEKLKVVITDSCLALLKERKLTRHKLSKLFQNKDWRKQLPDLGVSL